jgi:ketosteroid isomerase-like protein
MSRQPLPPVAAVLSFINCINRTDLDGLVSLMAEDHALKILDERPVVGREANRNAWRGYMSAFPHYVIYPERIEERGSEVTVRGTTSGSHLKLPDEEERKLVVTWVGVVERNGGLLTSWAIVDETSISAPAKGETLQIGQAQGSRRYMLGDRVVTGGEILEMCCSGGWLTGRFEWSGQLEDAPTFFFSIELDGGQVAQHSMPLPEGALLRRAAR